MKNRLRPACSAAFHAPLSVVARACLAAFFVNANAWSQAIPVNTGAGQFISKSGNANVVTGLPSGQTVIRLENNKSILEWARLNVAQGNSLQFIQPNQQSVVLNRVTGSDVTRIDGSLLSNGHVWLLNPSGVLFGANSTVNVQSLLATTRAISDADFLTNKLHFAAGGSGQVANAGVIAVGEGGYVVLSGQNVQNTGNIQAQLGQVHLASGKAFVIDLNGDKLLRFDVTQALSPSDASEATAKNAGNIVADGGRVQITARAANGLVGQVVNTGGLLQANSVRSVNGEIVLDAGPGGKTSLGGNLSAQGLDTNTKGGNITVLGETIQIVSDARLNASGQAGGGNVLVGGDWQGSGSLQQAQTVDMQKGATIQANATLNGDGGKVVLWSDLKAEKGSTSFAGVIHATAGPEGGQGGKVETSGHALNIDASGQVNSSSPKGQAGQWLLDPVNVTIDAAAATSIQNALSTNNVLVTTAGSSTPANVNPFTSVRVGEAGSDGNIYVNAPMSWNKYALSLEAHGNVYINAPITIGATDNTFNPGTFGGLSIRTGYSTPAVNGGTYDATKALIFAKAATGFTGKIAINDDAGNARTGFGFRLNDNDYTLIKNLTGLENISGSLNGKYALSGAIDASATSAPGYNGGAGFIPLGNAGTPFTGKLNGLGNTISNLYINRPNTNYVGLIGYANGADISHVGFISSNFTGQGQVGGVVGLMKNGVLSNSFSQNSQTTGLGEVGGLVGQLTVDDTQISTLNSSFYTGTVTGTSGGSVGGLVGLIYGETANSGNIKVERNFANATVSSTSSSIAGAIGNLILYGGVQVDVSDNFSKGSVTTTGDGVGGFLGSTDLNSAAHGVKPVSKLNVFRNYSNASVAGNNGIGGFGGQLWNGWSDSAFENNYATGSVTIAAGQTGGALIGFNQIPQSNSFATGNVSGGGRMAGVVGHNWANLTNLYWDTASTGQSSAVGKNESGTLVTQGLSASEMKQQSKFTGFDFATGASPWFIYEGKSLPLLTGFLTPLTITASGAAAQAYNGTTVYSGPVNLVYSTTPDNSKLLGSNAYILSAKNVGSRSISVDSQYSNQEGYLITFVNNLGNVQVTQAALNVTANAVTKTYDATTNATGSGTVGALAGSGAGEVVNAAGTQSFLDKNAGNNKAVRAAGVTIKDSGNADVTGNYNITYVDNTGSTINQAVLSVGITGVNKDYDGNTNATVITTDNRIGSDIFSVSTSARFADPFAATNKSVTVSNISLNGADAANYTLANTSGSTSASINPSQTNVAVQVAASAVMPAAATTNVFASPTLTSSTTATATSSATTSGSTPSGAASNTSSASTSSTTAGSATTSSATSATTTSAATNAAVSDEPTNAAVANQTASTPGTAATNTVAATPTTATISVNTQSVAPTVTAAATQAANATQTASNTGVATSNTSAQVQIVSLNNTTARNTPAVGAQTIAPVQTPKSAEDQADPVLAAVSSFKPATPATTTNRGPARGRDAPVVVPLVQGVLVMETSPPKAATQAVDEQRLSASGDRSRW